MKTIDNSINEKAYADHFGSLGVNVLSKPAIAGFDAWYARILPEDKTSSIFDFGCGRGEFLDYLKIRGYRSISGGDINSGLVDMAFKRTGLDLQKIGNMEEFIEKNKEKYDIVNLKDVAEHIEKTELQDFLIKLAKILKPGGMILVSGPQICGFTSVFTLYDDFTHRTLFTSNSLSFVLKSAGYKDIKLVKPYVPFSLSPTKIALRMARYFWFLFIKTAYLIERTGERMPEVFGDRIMMTAKKPEKTI